jgi:plastocyanin
MLVVGLLGAACGGNAEPADDADDADAAAGATVEVLAVDYAFDDVPAAVEPGTSLAFTNTSDVEVHEMVVLRVDDDETRSLEELLELSDDEAEQLTEYVGMRVALPGEDGLDPENPDASDGVTLDKPGRYVLLCFIPEGAEVQPYRDAIEGDSGGPPQVDGGPPHAAIGMASEVTVTE